MTSASPPTALGIDIGGTGMKAGIVSLERGDLIGDRVRIDTPHPATPEAMAPVVVELVEALDFTGPIGAAFPGIVQNGIISLAANLDDSWLNVDADALLTEALGQDVVMLNDADAAGLAEISFGAAKDQKDVVLLITLGTGIGSALFIDGVLVPNTELGHLHLDNHHDIESWVAASARKRDDLTWDEYGMRLNRYLSHLHKIFSPSLIVLGGGGSKSFDRFADQLNNLCPIVPAKLRNNSGIVGAAMQGAINFGQR
ncbi:MAG: polyphosphate--glucose phosphotransferase [Acidimicrobiales bacterium]|jgi:polyphosphate glucokinase